MLLIYTTLIMLLLAGCASMGGGEGSNNAAIQTNVDTSINGSGALVVVDHSIPWICIFGGIAILGICCRNISSKGGFQWHLEAGKNMHLNEESGDS